MGEGKGLKMNVMVFVGRKNEIVGELNHTLKVLATAFGVELYDTVRHGHLFFLVFMMVPYAMHAISSSIAETAHHVMVFGAVMELHVPTDRDKQHRKGHQ